MHRVLENGVAKHGEGGGRFPQVSGLRFEFDPSKMPGKRIEQRSIRINNHKLELNKVQQLYLKNILCLDLQYMYINSVID